MDGGSLLSLDFEFLIVEGRAGLNSRCTAVATVVLQQLAFVTTGFACSHPEFAYDFGKLALRSNTFFEPAHDADGPAAWAGASAKPTKQYMDRITPNADFNRMMVASSAYWVLINR